ncbi:hypothetical protein Celaphus_00013145 [Cervus elaphus hippelaphus]|uniref:Uncharacterized protein n=1 Tax=Cervus elaphus hippelaphus TaxID=46360 RepID=A0A212DGL3_CEREH|nr:hypothetical protein Celaphus_00013145 [Cervus elaphus hippelaphus]
MQKIRAAPKLNWKIRKHSLLRGKHTMTHNSANRNEQGCVHPHKASMMCHSKGEPVSPWRVVGTGKKTEAMVSSAHTHSPSGLPASPELLAVTSLSAEARQRPSAAEGPSVGGHPHPLPCHPLGPSCPPGILSALELGCSQPSATTD